VGSRPHDVDRRHPEVARVAETRVLEVATWIGGEEEVPKQPIEVNSLGLPIEFCGHGLR
jgi:hypothetical protein